MPYISINYKLFMALQCHLFYNSLDSSSRGIETGKYHLLLMLLNSTFVAHASIALRHWITIRWLSDHSATHGILLKTDFAFELGIFVIDKYHRQFKTFKIIFLVKLRRLWPLEVVVDSLFIPLSNWNEAHNSILQCKYETLFRPQTWEFSHNQQQVPQELDLTERGTQWMWYTWKCPFSLGKSKW